MSALLMAVHINVNSEKTTEIIAIDITDDKLALAYEIGATHTINAQFLDPLDAVMEVTSGCGVDYAVEAAGLRQTMELAFRSVRDGGGMAVIAGNIEYGNTIEIDPFDLIKGKRIISTWGGETNPDRDIPVYVDLYRSDKLNLELLLSHCYSLDKVNEAIERLRISESACRVLLEF